MEGSKKEQDNLGCIVGRRKSYSGCIIWDIELADRLAIGCEVQEYPGCHLSIWLAWLKNYGALLADMVNTNKEIDYLGMEREIISLSLWKCCSTGKYL